jgi:hypothetical protein
MSFGLIGFTRGTRGISLWEKAEKLFKTTARMMLNTAAFIFFMISSFYRNDHVYG